MVNSESDFNEIFIENTVGPPQDPMRIKFREGITARDILLELDMSGDEFSLMTNLEERLSLDDIIPPNAELMLIPGSSAGGTVFEGILNDLSKIFGNVGNKRLAELFYGNRDNLKLKTANAIKGRIDLSRNVINMMYQIQKKLNSRNPNFKDIKSTDLKRMKAESLGYLYNYITTNILSDYTSKLFSEYYIKTNSFNSLNGLELSFVMNLVENIDEFHRYEASLNELHAFTDKQKADFDEFIENFWGKSYTELLVESVIEEEFFNLDFVDKIKAKFGYDINLETLIGITEPLQIVDEYGNEMIDFGPIWIDIGAENYGRPHRGNGFEHIIQEHLIINPDFTDINSDLKIPKDVNKFLFKSIHKQTGVIITRTSQSYEVAYRMLDQNGNIILDKYGNPQFFSIILWHSEFNRIHTGFPTFANRNNDINIIFNNIGI